MLKLQSETNDDKKKIKNSREILPFNKKVLLRFAVTLDDSGKEVVMLLKKLFPNCFESEYSEN